VWLKIYLIKIFLLTFILFDVSSMIIFNNPISIKDESKSVDSVAFKPNYVEIIHDNGKGAFPASYVYDNLWNTLNPNPYPDDFAKEDSLIKLTLVTNDNDFSLPGEYRLITSSYGYRDGRFHEGIDLDIYQGEDVNAVFSGVVRVARTYLGYGRIVVIRHDNGLETYYAHLSRIFVKTGQRISAGERIGLSGNSGTSRGTHLHFEIRFKGVSFNPCHIICFKEQKLKFNEIILRQYNSRYFVYNENAIIHKVRRGDFLYKIAAEYGTTVKKIREDNDISRNGILRVGQLISIYP